MAMSGHTVSVVTANYNHASLIENAIRSIAQQTHKVIEHIIVDDRSTDNSRDVIRALIKQYPHVRLIENEQNMGPARASGRALHAAVGEYIQFLSADDILPPNSIAARLAVVKGNDKALICGDIGYVDAKTGAVDHRRYFSADRPIHFSREELVDQQRNGLIIVNGGSALARREDLIAAKIDDAALKWHCDSIGFNTVAYRRGLWYVPGIQQLFLKGEGSFSKASRDWRQQKEVLNRIFELLDSPEFTDVRTAFRDTGLLSSSQHILRYLLLNPKHREFLTLALVRKALAYMCFRGLNQIIPAALVSYYVNARSVRFANRAAP